LESKSAALVAAVFVDFPKNKCNFMHKSKLDIVRRVQFLSGRRTMRSFSPGAVATIALCKSDWGSEIVACRPGVDVEGVGSAGVFIVVYQRRDDHGEDFNVGQPHLHSALLLPTLQCTVSI